MECAYRVMLSDKLVLRLSALVSTLANRKFFALAL